MKKTSLLFSLVVVAAALLMTSCSDSDGEKEVKPPEDKRVSLFDGKTLDGWTILKCEASVDEGDILIIEGDGLIQSEKKYGDFILEFDWKALRDDKWDSGVYFRYDTVPEGRPWPGRYQVNLRQGMEGNVGALEGAKTASQTEF